MTLTRLEEISSVECRYRATELFFEFSSEPLNGRFRQLSIRKVLGAIQSFHHFSELTVTDHDHDKTASSTVQPLPC